MERGAGRDAGAQLVLMLWDGGWVHTNSLVYGLEKGVVRTDSLVSVGIIVVAIPGRPFVQGKGVGVALTCDPPPPRMHHKASIIRQSINAQYRQEAHTGWFGSLQTNCTST